ncbi:MAG: hypothetical protein QOG05_7169 [Streptosporangiaceae bacterium]|jgi:hypothetical protein|nr:hypothetical protein [Streptosporangiaceae bacterium]
MVSAKPRGSPRRKRAASQASWAGKRRCNHVASRLRASLVTCRPVQDCGSRALRTRCPTTSARTTTTNKAMPTWVA